MHRDSANKAGGDMIDGRAVYIMMNRVFLHPLAFNIAMIGFAVPSFV
jgi:hypothetical protein